MDIACYLVTKGKLEKRLVPEKLLLQLAKVLRTEGEEIVHFKDNTSILVEGIYIPAKESKTSIMLIPNIED